MDPRFDTTRSFNVLLSTFKSLAVGHDALARDTNAAAQAVEDWGLERVSDRRHDGVGDPVITDIGRHLAALFREMAHVEASENAAIERTRHGLLAILKAEQALSTPRANRAKASRELKGIRSEQYARGERENDHTAQLEQRIQTMQQNSKEMEQEIAETLRNGMRDGMGMYFDELERYGEKLAILARYGKQLAATIPSGAPEFPASTPHAMYNAWDGANEANAIRHSLHPAMQHYRPSGRTEPILSSSQYEHEEAEEQEHGYESQESQINLNPATLPPPSQVSGSSPRPPQVSPGPMPRGEEEVEETGTAPLDPTVAETGIVPQGSSGPASGQLRRTQ